MATGIPGLAGTDHIGITVPDIDAATDFFVNVIGCVVVFETGPFAADVDWMKVHLNVHPRAVVNRLRMLKCRNGPSFELFEYALDGSAEVPPANSDVGGHHLAFYVTDIAAAVAYLRAHDVDIQGEPTTMTDGPSAGLTWVYFLAPWGLQMELVCYADGMAYEAGGAEVLWSPVGE